ncbi:hypothetical protein ACPF4J_003734, partial [Vibrio cholerae]
RRSNMEQIYENLGTLEWWFNILFAIGLGIVVHRIVDNVPNWLSTFKRKQRLNRLKVAKKLRWDGAAINYEISKANSRFLVFALSCVCFLTWLSYKPVQQLFEFNVFVGMITSIPIYVCEVIWLKQDVLVTEILKQRGKLRITNASRGTVNARRFQSH